MISRDQPIRAADGDVQVIMLPRCRKQDGGCGSHRVHAQRTKKQNGTTVRYYSCLQCGRRFKAIVM